MSSKIASEYAEEGVDRAPSTNQSHDDEERRPLLSDRSSSIATSSPTSGHATDSTQGSKRRVVLHTLYRSALFFGVFLANVDTSFVLATYNSIASQFNSTSTGSWILIAYNLGSTVVLPMCGAFSKIFGSKRVLLVAYIVFAAGCALSASAAAVWQVVAGRLVAGVGGACITTTVMVIMTENLEPSDVGVLRSYVNLVAIVGRSTGGPIGGIITDLIGWRWSFLVQIPAVILCFVLALTHILTVQPHSHRQPAQSTPQGDGDPRPNRSFNLLGTITLTVFLTTILLGITAIGHADLVSKATVIPTASAFIVSGVLFVLIERFYAETPVVPRECSKGPVMTQMLIQVLLLFAQYSVVSNIGAYFARTETASNSVAALHLIPVPIGNAVGSLSAGQIIKRTKRYKILAIIGLLVSTLGFTLMSLRWRGRINVLESLYVAACSLGVGLTNTTQFVALTSSADAESHPASLVSFFFLSQQIGLMLGAATSNVIVQTIFKNRLLSQLGEFPGKIQVIQRILEDTRYASLLPESLQAAVISSYGIAFSTICVISAAILVALQVPLALLREHPIQ